MRGQSDNQTKYEPDDPREWLRLAREDLALAKARTPGVGLELRAYHAQQAAEKALKAVCIARGLVFPFTHDLKALLDLLAHDDLAIPAGIRAAQRLTEFAEAGRYPRQTSMTAGDLESALKCARQVTDWAATNSSAGPGRVREAGKPVYAARRDSDGRDAPDPELLDEIVTRIVAAVAPQRIILFGSGARGTMGPYSDLDLMVVTAEPDAERTMYGAIRGSLAGLRGPFDIVVVTQADLERYGRSIGLVYRPALEDGRELYRRATSAGKR